MIEHMIYPIDDNEMISFLLLSYDTTINEGEEGDVWEEERKKDRRDYRGYLIT